jgi:putative transposase
MEYRRVQFAGGCYFFTVVLAERGSDLLVRNIDALRLAFKTVKNKHPFEINAIVVLPDHLHCLWTLPAYDADYSTRWALIKAGFSRQIPKSELIRISCAKKGERGIWQRRFWEHTIRDERDFLNHIDYIHQNPVKHQFVSKAEDWKFSSIHAFMKAH